MEEHGKLGYINIIMQISKVFPEQK